jgi:hypothetical protein
MRTIARMQALETLILDHCNELDQAGMELLVEESKAQIAEHDAEKEEKRRGGSRDALHDSDPSPRVVSLMHLELNSCSQLPLSSLMSLALHPTLVSLEVSGRAVRDEPANLNLMNQLEELSGGRVSVNGGMDQRHKNKQRSEWGEPGRELELHTYAE